MHDERPDPDAILAKVAAEERSRTRGKLQVFFGYCAGVGKTYAMLGAAAAAKRAGRSVVIGWLEPHARPDTTAQAFGLERLPHAKFVQSGIGVQDLDLDGVLARSPDLVVVDELAHSNPDGARHPKRWQDVFELLDAGIDVLTTVNVQHVESLNDVVARITGIVVRETVPDVVFDRVDEIELVDLPPDELLERFRRGLVYVPTQATVATQRFFKKETLVALRELALRRAAEHVHRQVELGRRSLVGRPIWATRHSLLVAVGPSPSSARLVRATRRLATEQRAPWFAAAVVHPAEIGDPTVRSGSALDENLRLAEQLGAETVTLVDDDVADALVRFARDRGITRVVVGKTRESRWRRALRPSVVERLLSRALDLEILVLPSDRDDEAPTATASGPQRREPRRQPWWRRSASAALVLAGTTLLGLGLVRLSFSDADIVGLYFLAITTVAYTSGLRVSIASSVAAVLLFNFFFTEPYHTFAVHDPGYLVTFAVLLSIGLVVSALVDRIRAQAIAARARADASDVLYRIGRALGTATTARRIAVDAQMLLEQLLGVHAAIALVHADGQSLGEAFGSPTLLASERERAVAQWALSNAAAAGAGTDTLPAAAALHLPLVGRTGTRYGVLAVQRSEGEAASHDLRRTLDSVAALLAQGLERCALEEVARQSARAVDAERVRSDLLATVSHDLRTPLAAIGGATDTVRRSTRSAIDPADRALLDDVLTESARLGRLVENLLHLGRAQAGEGALVRVWSPLEEAVGDALRQVGRAHDTARVSVVLEDRPLLVLCDAALVAQALANLIENALVYAPHGPIEVRARRSDARVVIDVADRGPGFPAQGREQLFARFERGPAGRASTRGSGLGLAICRAVAEAHGGTIEALDRDGGGACVRFVLPDPSAATPPGSAFEPAAPEA